MSFPDTIETFFDCPRRLLDTKLLEATFTDVALKEVYARSGGDISFFANIDQATDLQYAIGASWPEVYYLRKLADEGFVHMFQDAGQEAVYAVKQSYSPMLNTILIEEDTFSG